MNKKGLDKIVMMVMIIVMIIFFAINVTSVSALISGDANDDGVVNQIDCEILRSNYGSPGGWAEGDFDGNFIVDLLDCDILEIAGVECCPFCGDGSCNQGEDLINCLQDCSGLGPSKCGVWCVPGTFLGIGFARSWEDLKRQCDNAKASIGLAICGTFPPVSSAYCNFWWNATKEGWDTNMGPCCCIPGCDATLSQLRTWCDEEGEPTDGPKTTEIDPCDGRGNPLVCDGGYVGISHDPQTIPYNIEIGSETNFTINLKGLAEIEGGAAPADIMYVLDRSGSMASDSDSMAIPKIDTAKSALEKIHRHFYNYWFETDQTKNYFKMGLVSFNHEPQVNAFLNYIDDVNFQYEEISACGCTGVDAGLVDAAYKNFDDSQLSCQDGSVKRVIVLASDGMQNREINSLNDYPFPEFNYLRDNFLWVQNLTIDKPNITFYTIGIGDVGVWADNLRDIAYKWGIGDGLYFSSPAITDLYDVYEDIADVYMNNSPAKLVLVTIILTDDFEYVSSTIAPSRINGNLIEWTIQDIDLTEIISFKVTVTAKSGDGIVNVIKTAGESNIKIFNKCGMEKIDFEEDITANIGEPVTPPTGIYWADMNEVKIGNDVGIDGVNAQIGDSIKMIWENAGLSPGTNLDFTIQELTYINEWVYDEDNPIIGIVNPDGDAIAIWAITQADFDKTGQHEKYLFHVDSKDSNELTIEETPNNEPPVAIITSPKDRQIYFTGTDLVFNQSSYDLDGELTYKWDLGDGRTSTENSFIASYDTPGQKEIILNASDNGKSDIAKISILILESGSDDAGVLSYIDTPKWGESYNRTINLDSSGSYVVEYFSETEAVNCLSGNCPLTTGNCPTGSSCSSGYLNVNNIPTPINYAGLEFQWYVLNGLLGTITNVNITDISTTTVTLETPSIPSKPHIVDLNLVYTY